MSEGTATPRAPMAPGVVTDERLRPTSLWKKLLARPELGAVAGAIAVWLFFAVVAGSSGFLTVRGTAAYLEVAAELGILAVPVSLLMIAGEFDLSIGTMIGATGMIIAVLASPDGFAFPVWFGIIVAAIFAVVVGFLNGLVVVKTRLPSFIVTLGTFFILAGVTIGMTRFLTGQTTLGKLNQVSDYGSAHVLFGSTIGRFNVSIVWWIVIAAVATWVLLRTRFGNWIFGMVQQGIVFAGIDSDWYKAFLGAMLIVAVLLNNLIRSRLAERR